MYLILTDSGVHKRLSDTLWIIVLLALEDGAGNKLQLKLKAQKINRITTKHVRWFSHVYNMFTCVLPVLFSGVWFLSHTSAPWDGSKSYAASRMSDKSKNMHRVKIKCCIQTLFYNEEGLLNCCTSVRTAGGVCHDVLSKTFFGRLFLSLFK